MRARARREATPGPRCPLPPAHHTTPRAPAQLVPRNGLQYQWGGRGKPVANGGPRKPLLPCSNECRGGARLLHCPHVKRQPSRGPRCTKAPKVISLTRFTFDTFRTIYTHGSVEIFVRLWLWTGRMCTAHSRGLTKSSKNPLGYPGCETVD